MTARKEVIQAVGTRYKQASKADKARILDESSKLTGYHRKHAIRVLVPRTYERRRRPKADKYPWLKVELSGKNSFIVSTTRRYDICAASLACKAISSGVARSGMIVASGDSGALMKKGGSHSHVMMRGLQKLIVPNTVSILRCR